MASTSTWWIDVREYPEYSAGYIAGSKLAPLGRLAEASEGWPRKQAITLVCGSGQRAEQGRQMLAAKGFVLLTVLEGGVEGWKLAGRPLVTLGKRPWSLERQVRVGAGSLVLVTLGLGYFVSPMWLMGTAFVGAGLVFAGVSNICLMATILGRMPWNRAPETMLELS